MEQKFYDYKPYIITLIGLYGISQMMASPAAAMFGIVLLACGALIVTWRTRAREFYRKQYEALPR